MLGCVEKGIDLNETKVNFLAKTSTGLEPHCSELKLRFSPLDPSGMLGHVKQIIDLKQFKVGKKLRSVLNYIAPNWYQSRHQKTI